MATTVDTLLVRIEADMRDVRRDLASLEKRTETASRSISKSMGRIGTVTQAVIGGVLVQQFARGILSLTNFASDMEEMSSMSEAVFGGFVDSVRNKLGEFGDEVGRSRFELEAMAASVQDTFVPLGFARGQAAELSVELTKLAVDVASFKNELETDVMAAFQSALVGNHEAVRRFGIVITEAELQNELFRMGITENAKQVDAQTKVQARLNLILAGTTDAQGDAARTSGSYANMTRALDAQVKLLANDIGQELLPAMKDLVAITTDSIKGFRNFLRAIGLVTGKHDALVKNLQRVKDAQEDVDNLTKAVDKTFGKHQPFVDRLAEAQKELAAALAEQDALFEPIIDGIMGVGQASDETAGSTEKLNNKLSEGEKVVHGLLLQIAQLKADQNDTTGITSKLLAIQAKLGDEYMEHAQLITELVEKIHAMTTASEKETEVQKKRAEALAEIKKQIKEVIAANEEAASSRVINKILKNIDAQKAYNATVKDLTENTRLLNLEAAGASEANLIAERIIGQLGITAARTKQSIRDMAQSFVEAQTAAEASKSANDEFNASVAAGVSFVDNNKTEMEKLGENIENVTNAYRAGKISIEEFEAAIEALANKNEELTPMMQEMKSGLEGVAKGIGDSFADMVVDGKFSLDSFEDIFKNFVKRMIAKAIEMFIIEQIFSSIFPTFGFGGGGTVPARAGGGHASGPILVGERGPELFVPSSTGSIKNNMDTQNILGSGQTNVVNQTINIETGVAQTVRAEVLNLMPQIRQNTMAAMVDARKRGGSMAAVFGG